jgi:4-hydroxybenzoate polyprenyltransferase
MVAARGRAGRAESEVIRDLVTLARPRGMFLVSLVPTLGFSFAYWDHGCVAPGWSALPRLGLLMLVWAVPHAGTMWLNAALDRDESPTLYGRAAKVPDGIERWAYLTLLFAVALGFWMNVGLGVCVVLCAALSILYSHPKTAWKGHAVLGPLTNAVGYGTLSPIGGFLYAGYAPTIRAGLILLAAIPWMLTAYFAAQAFQEDEDRARGYRTLVATHGAAVTLRVTRACLYVALAMSVTYALVGIVPRIVLVPLPLFVLLHRYLSRWMAQPKGGNASWAGGFFGRLAGVALLVLLSVSIDYELSMRSMQLPGGLTTASGLFETRACASMWPAWSARHDRTAIDHAM